MKHDWEDVHSEVGRTNPMKALAIRGARRCRNCGAYQEKWANQSWMRVTGYSWEPKAGRCTGKPKKD